MGMKHILRALDQALETAEVERKYLRDELEAERVEKRQRLAAELEQLRGQAEEPRASWTSCWKPSGSEERTWAGEREDMAGSCGRCAGKRSACRERWTAWRVKTRSCRRRWKNGRNHADQGTWAVTRTCATPTAGKKVVSFSWRYRAGKKAQGKLWRTGTPATPGSGWRTSASSTCARGKGACAGAAPGGGLSEQAGQESPGGPESDSAQAGDAGRQTGGTGPWSGKGQTGRKPDRAGSSGYTQVEPDRLPLTAAAGCAACVAGCLDRRRGVPRAVRGMEPRRKKQDARFADQDRHGEVTAYTSGTTMGKEAKGRAKHVRVTVEGAGAPSIFSPAAGAGDPLQRGI